MNYYYRFCWKSFSSEEEESTERESMKLIMTTRQALAEERFDQESHENESLKDRVSVLTRSFKHKQSLLQRNQFYFLDDSIKIDPLEGEVWPHSSTYITFSFYPSEDTNYTCTAYCMVTGRKSRLPLTLSGDGLGANLELNLDRLDIGQICLGTTHTYEVILRNKGYIEAEFSLIEEFQHPLLAELFSFSHKSGSLAPGNLQSIEITFSCPEDCSPFEIEFTWMVKGNRIPIRLTIVGAVIQPTYILSKEQLNFGIIPFGFTHSETFTITNTSAILIQYYLYVPHDGDRPKVTTSFMGPCDDSMREFAIYPNSAKLAPNESNIVNINFYPSQAKAYRHQMVMDIIGVCQGVCSIPITAHVRSPTIVATITVIQCGRCFVGNRFTKEIKLINDDTLDARFYIEEVTESIDDSILITSPNLEGLILAGETITVPVDLEVRKIGEHADSIKFIVAGSQQEINIDVKYIGEGPVIRVTPTFINWGKLPVFRSSTFEISMTNQAPTKTNFNCSLINESNVFLFEPMEGQIEPYGTQQLQISACLNDNFKFTNKLGIHFDYDVTRYVTLEAQGEGVTIISDPPLKPKIDFGYFYNSNTFRETFRLTNKGTRLHILTWNISSHANQRGKKQNELRLDPLDLANAKKISTLSKDVPASVKIVPQELYLPPGQSAELTIEVYSSISRKVTETLLCYALIGRNTTKNLLIEVEFTLNFIQPLIRSSLEQLEFNCVQDNKGMLNVVSHPLTLQNISSLPLHLTIDVPRPFFILSIEDNDKLVNEVKLEMLAERSIILSILFDPLARSGKHSYALQENLTIKYSQHPSEESIQLFASVNFPNVSLSRPSIDFGTILNNTDILEKVRMENTSPIVVKYSWCFQEWTENNIQKSTVDLAASTSLLDDAYLTSGSHIRPSIRDSVDGDINSSYSIVPPPRPLFQPWGDGNDPFAIAPINQIFDILPIYGTLQPDEIIDVEFSFYGKSNSSLSVVALCTVEQGPEYQVELKGRASCMKYKLNKNILNLSQCHYAQCSQREIEIFNVGLVDFTYAILKPEISNSGEESKIDPYSLIIEPNSHRITAGGSQKLTVRFTPDVPGVFQSDFYISIAHFEPERIRIVGEGLFPNIRFRDVRRPKLEEFLSLLNNTAASRIINRTNIEKLVDPEVQLEQNVISQFAQSLQQSNQTSNAVQQEIKQQPRPVLPAYQLDFGYVVLGKVSKRMLTLYNPSMFHVNLNVSQVSYLKKTGITFNCVKFVNIPPDGYCEVEIKFDPSTAEIPCGPFEIVCHFLLSDGPEVPLICTGEVLLPDLELSHDELDFEDVTVSRCKIITIQLHNPTSVRCIWEASVPSPPKRINRFIPLHLKKKGQVPKRAPNFELLPSRGVIEPGNRLSIKVKFAPTEQTHYSRQVIFKIRDNLNSSHILPIRGNGLEQQLHFSTSVIEFGPVLPFFEGQAKEVVVTNPTPFACEIFSLEFDSVYIEEETLLQQTSGYDKYSQLLLPPRVPSEPLPEELLSWWSKQKQEMLKIEIDDNLEPMTPLLTKISDTIADGSEIFQYDNSEYLDKVSTTGSTPSLMKDFDYLKLPPNLQAVARHIGLDFSQKGKNTRLEQGIVFLIYGAPYSGKSTQALSLSQQYNIPILNTNAAIIDAIKEGTLPAAQEARQLCVQAKEKAKEKVDEGMVEPEVVTKDKNMKTDPSSQSQPLWYPTVTEFEIKDGISEDPIQLVSTVLPDNVLHEILYERLHREECFTGVVIDSLDSSFIIEPQQLLKQLLIILQSRKFLYIIQLNVTSEFATDLRLKKIEEAKMKERLALNNNLYPTDVTDAYKEPIIDLSDEEGYELLNDAQKQIINKKRIKKRKEELERKRKEKEEQERILREKEQERILADDLKKKSKKDKGSKPSMALRNSSQENLKAGAKPVQRETPQPLPAQGASPVATSPTQSRPDSVSSEKALKKKCNLFAPKLVPSASTEEGELASIYSKYEKIMLNIRQIIELWDTEKFDVYTIHEPQPEESAVNTGRKSKKESKSKDFQIGSFDELEHLIANKPDNIGLPNYILNISDSENSQQVNTKLLEIEGVPSLEYLKNYLGIGSRGPHITPDFELSIANLPSLRQKSEISGLDKCFHFVAASPDDPNVAELKLEDEDEEIIKQQTIILPIHEELEPIPPPPRKDVQSRGSIESVRGSRRSSKRPPRKTEDPRSSTPKTAISDVEEPNIQEEEIPPNSTQAIEPATKRLLKHRWVIPAQGSTTLRIQFSSSEIGNFDETMHFEIVGSNRRYQLYCRGICAVPRICIDPRIVFSAVKKTKQAGEIVKKKFILEKDLYEFGPLSHFRSREKRFQSKHPENIEELTIFNNSSLACSLNFSFKEDNAGQTFLLEPESMELESNEKRKLLIWAYPKQPHEYNDVLICSIHNNPIPVSFKLNAICVKPELKLDRYDFKFEKILLHRRETREIYLKNTTLLPVSWKLATGDKVTVQDADYDIYTFNREEGVVEPLSEFALVCYFRSPRPITIKKTMRLEVSSLDNTIGLLSTENLSLHVEAYDVALDISFPKGSDGKLDFQCIRVFEEAKQMCNMKNKGKYEIHYQFLHEKVNGVDVNDYFNITPSKGALFPGEKAQPVTVIFTPKQAITLDNYPAIKCQVTDPTHNETVASIPIQILAKSVFSEFKIHPLNDINFGPVILHGGSKQQKILTIENTGVFEFRYTILKLSTSLIIAKQRGAGASSRRARSRMEEGGRMSAKPNRGKIAMFDGKNDGSTIPNRLTFGAFTIQPTNAIIQPGQTQQVIVECHPETTGIFEEELAIDVYDKDPMLLGEGVHYRIICESCVPSINIRDISAFCEEHRICKSLKSISNNSLLLKGPDAGIFFEHERIFRFNTIVVGRQTEARFKIQNNGKVPCDIQCAAKLSGSPTKGQSKSFEIFDTDPSKFHLLPHTHKFVSVFFKPQAIQTYHAQFSANLEGPAIVQKGRGLLFDIQGDGSLPRVSVTQPAATDQCGRHIMIFKRIVVGKSQTLPFTLSNTGHMPAIVSVQLDNEAKGDFQLNLTGYPKMKLDKELSEDILSASAQQHIIRLEPSEKCKFGVVHFPQEAGESKFSIDILVQDNPYENNQIMMFAESYIDEFIIDNILGFEVNPSVAASLDSSLIKSSSENHLNFGDCAVSEEKQLTFCITNSSRDVFSFNFTTKETSVTFIPTKGHLLSGKSKEILATFLSSKPLKIDLVPIMCNLCKISYIDAPAHLDWDDRMKITKWLPIAPTPLPARKTSDEERASAISLSQTYNISTAQVNLGTTVSYQPLPPQRRRVVEVEPEPTHNILPDTNRHFELIISALADFPAVECNVNSIQLKDTMMFQALKYRFELRNTSKIAASFRLYLEAPVFPDLVSLETEENADGFETLYIGASPSSGKIQPNQILPITLKFSPLDVLQLDAKLIIRLENSTPDQKDLEIQVTGQSVMPYCHFDLPTISYANLAATLDIKSSTASYTTPLNPSTRVLTFEASGIGIRVVKSFNVINPTNLTYDFIWQPDLKEESRKPFNCLTYSGVIEPGKKYEMQFEYVSISSETEECLWKFTVPSLALALPLLFVGYMVEPKVYIDRTYLHFKPQLVSHVCLDTVFLVNDEDIVYTFSVQEASCHMPGQQVCLNVTPSSGKLEPHTRFPVKISLPLKTQAEYSYNLKFDIKNRQQPLILNVKASAYLSKATLQVRSTDSEQFTILPLKMVLDEIQCIDFGEVQLNEKAFVNLNLSNEGLFVFDYFWQLSEKCFKLGGIESEDGQLVNIKPQSGSIEPNSSDNFELSLCPQIPISLKNCNITCHIRDGPVFKFDLKGKCIKPALQFSFTKYNFGLCFIFHPSLPLNSTTLKITNNDTSKMTVACLTHSLPHLAVDFEPTLLQPNEATEVGLVFMPRDSVRYFETIEFQINGVTKHCVDIVGQGTELNLEVVKPAKKTVNFGVLRVGECMQKKVTIVNNSLAPIDFTLQIAGISGVATLLTSSILIISPCDKIHLKPQGDSVDVEVTFRPNSRIPQFTEEVMFEVSRLSKPLFMFSGCCQGIDLCLSTNHIPFGQVCLNSFSTKQLVLYNKGDIGAHFNWKKSSFEPDFKITPLKGYINANKELVFKLDFCPQAPNNDIRYEDIELELEGTNPLLLTLTGMCSEVTPREVIQFSTNVRTKETKQIQLSLPRIINIIQLKPIITGEHWSGAELLTIEPNQTKNYEVTYHPMVMSGDHKKHYGSIFFPLPDGLGLLYSLVGISESPKNIESRTVEVPCKTKHTEQLHVPNWTKTNQHFKVTREILKPDKPDGSLSISGIDYIDVPGDSHREYNLNFLAFKVGTVFTKVTFKNEETGEYCFYLVTFKATPCVLIDVIKLETTVRQRIYHTITIQNPLPTQVNMSTNCNLRDIQMPVQFLVGAQSDGTFTFEYLPLKLGESSGELTLSSADLGVYHYTLHLTAHPAPLEPSVQLVGFLGSNVVQTVYFTSYSKAQRVEYQCKIDHPDFHVEKNVFAAPAPSGGTEVKLEVQFEPCKLGTTNATLSITSAAGGEYQIPLIGECKLPKPQGPFVIRAGHSITIPFKNVFTSPVNYVYSVDNTAFQVRFTEQMKPKKSYNIGVNFDPKHSDSYGTNTGKLIVKCPAGTGNCLTSISWIFYLKGLL